MQWDEYQHAIRGYDRKRNNLTPFKYREFAACDGEGVTRDNGRHEYVLLRVGDQELLHKDGRGLTSHDCLNFIAGLDPDRIYVGYYFDYDVTKILQGLPAEKLERLLCRELRTNDDGKLMPFDYQGYQIEYLKGKMLKVRRKGGPWITINDVGSFFQCSFVKALQAWFPEPRWEPVIEKIFEGKTRRAGFGGLDEYMREYCALECQMLKGLMGKFREVCYELDLHPKEWQGPGRLVSAVLQREGYPRSKNVPLWNSPAGAELARLANSAYYGGRFEAGVIGDVPGPIYQYDINSAYPSVYRTLPCLLHGEWVEFRDKLPSEGELYVADIAFAHSSDVSYCGLPIRTTQGTLLFPLAGRGIYWSHEITEALPYLTRHTAHHGYRYVPTCSCDTFAWVEPMYHERKRLGKSGKGIVLKLALNSTYGKLCQSVGTPTFANPVHASLITSHTRAQLYRAIMENGTGNDVIMAATDGIFTLSPRNLPCGTALGEWEQTIHDNIFVVQSGVYYIDGQLPKTRGTPVSRLVDHETKFRQAWAEYLPEIRRWKTPADQQIRSVPIPVQNFISLPLALAWNKPELAGQWVTDTRHIAFEWFSKRTIFTGLTPTRNRTGSYLVTRPQPGAPNVQSVAYTKSIGGVLARIRADPREEARVMDETQPDWNENPL